MTKIDLGHMDRCIMSIKSILLISTILLSFDGLSAEKLTVYRWIDENNVVHFSQHQPAHDNYTEIDMINNKNAATQIETKVAEQQVPIDKPDLTNIYSENTDNKKCQTAKENLVTLQNFDKIQYKDENGNIKVLSDIEKQQQLAINTTQAEVYCAENK